MRMGASVGVAIAMLATLVGVRGVWGLWGLWGLRGSTLALRPFTLAPSIIAAGNIDRGRSCIRSRSRSHSRSRELSICATLRNSAAAKVNGRRRYSDASVTPNGHRNEESAPPVSASDSRSHPPPPTPDSRLPVRSNRPLDSRYYDSRY